MSDKKPKKNKLTPNEYGGNWVSDLNVVVTNPLKTSGIEKFKEYDFKGAMADFKQVLLSEPDNVPTLFNLACCCSMEEDADQALIYLDKAVDLGFKDFNRIETHDRLAYLRIQQEYDLFKINGFHLPFWVIDKHRADKMESMTLEEKLKLLHDDHEAGKITNEDFVLATKKLLG